ncbi:MAG: flagellar basal body rod protein FlgB [Myxococcota bacterium]|nr:flagellar basal body rod protein FlgB [Myxococcota bacterium]
MTGIFEGVDVVARALDFHMLRQNLITGNIANVDTPGYAPKELQRAEQSDGSSFSLSLTATDGEHLTPSGVDRSGAYEVAEERNVVPGNDLNYVSMDWEMARLSANALRYEVVGKLVTKHLGVLHYAVQDR